MLDISLRGGVLAFAMEIGLRLITKRVVSKQITPTIIEKVENKLKKMIGE